MTPANPSKNVLNSDVEIKGNVKFAGELTLEGKLEGEVNSDGTLIIGETGTVNGNVSAGTVSVRGKINGNITARDKIEIKSKAEVFGDIRSAKLAIEEGVTFVGKTEVNPNKLAPSAAPRPATGPSGPAPEPAKAGIR
jgi:cytoskeletal protein CcmA (bactofilin family)